MNRMVMMAGIALALALGSAIPASAQKRIAFIPFKNLDGRMELNKWSDNLADSLMRAIVAVNPAQADFVIIPKDSLMAEMAKLKAVPGSAQYDSDLWKSAKKLRADKVITGNFVLRGERVLMNAYVYDAITKMPDQDHKAKELYKLPATYLQAVAEMVPELYPALTK